MFLEQKLTAILFFGLGPSSGSSNLPGPTMSKGRKYCTPQRHWRKFGKGNGRPWFARQTWRKTNPHVIGKNHKKFKWFFRCKRWFKDNSLKRMSMRFPMSHEIWGWD